MSKGARVIVFANQKGGVGKTTAVFNTAAGLAAIGKRCLLIDLDGQGNLTYSAAAKQSEKSAYSFLQGYTNLQETIQQVPIGDTLPANEADLSGADKKIQKTTKLKEALQRSEALYKYDYIFIDTPPALGMLTINAFTAADSVVIPTAADIMSLQGVNRVYETIKEVREQSNPKINVDGLLLFRYSNRTIISRQLAEEAALVAASMRCSVYRATIREAVQVRESQVEQQSLFEYAPTAKVTDDFRLFINELTGEYEEEADKIRAEREAAYNDK